MNYQGQNLCTSALKSTDDNKSSYSSLYGVSEERGKELKAQIIQHWRASEQEDGWNVALFFQTLPINALTPNELVLAGVYLGQFVVNEIQAPSPAQLLAGLLQK